MQTVFCHSTVGHAPAGRSRPAGAAGRASGQDGSGDEQQALLLRAVGERGSSERELATAQQKITDLQEQLSPAAASAGGADGLVPIFGTRQAPPVDAAPAPATLPIPVPAGLPASYEQPVGPYTIYPLGSVDYSVLLTAKDGETTTLKPPVLVNSSQLRVID